MKNWSVVLATSMAACLGYAGHVCAASQFTFTSLAGSAETVSSNVDGTGSAAQFSAPRGIAVDSTGTLYVADSSNHTIRKITANGVVTTLAGTPGTTGTTSATPAKFSEARFSAAQ